MIEQFKQVEKMKKVTKGLIERDTVEIYACMALCLSDAKYGWTSEQIEELINDTGYLWADCVQKTIPMTEWCKEVTGIDVKEITGNE